MANCPTMMRLRLRSGGSMGGDGAMEEGRRAASGAARTRKRGRPGRHRTCGAAAGRGSGASNLGPWEAALRLNKGAKPENYRVTGLGSALQFSRKVTSAAPGTGCNACFLASRASGSRGV